MYYWRDLDSVPEDFGPSVLTLGNFDGVHRGHQHVLQQVVEAARQRSAAAVVVSFADRVPFCDPKLLQKR